MRIKSVKLSNFCNYGKVEVNFDENVTFLIGKNGSGKSTIGITAIHAAFMGIAEKSKTALIGERFRFIGNGAVSASDELVLHDEIKNADITITRRITKTSNELSFKAPEGYHVDKEWLENLFNIFLIAPKKFADLSSKQQSEALGIDTSTFDTKIQALKDAYTVTNRDLTNMGKLETMAKVEKVDVSQLNTEKDQIITFNNLQTAKQTAIDKATEVKKNLDEELIEINRQIDELKEKGLSLIERIEKGTKYIENLPKPEKVKPLEEVNDKINNATTTNENAYKYTQYLEKVQKQTKLQNDLKKNNEDKAKLQADRIEYIKNQKLPFDGLTINEDGELLLNNKPIKEPYFSTGELLRIIPILMSAKNPELKYVFLQDFNLLDEDEQLAVEKALTDRGMQLVIELVGKKKVADRTCILLKDSQIVESYDEEKKPALI